MSETTKKPGLPEKILYGAGDVGLNATFTLFASYVLYFYTDVIGMNAAIIGTVILVSKIFDGVSDVIAGQWIDTHRGKKGHCIPILIKWSIPMVITSVLVFLVPDTSIAVRVLFVFVTYNLFNTVTYTMVACAHATLASYAAGDSVSRSQMLIYKMLFAATTQMILANVILPMVDFFGGRKSQTAWIMACMVFNLIGLVILFLNAFFVKERVKNEAPPENILQGVKSALTNKYWVMAAVIQICCQIHLIFNLSVSVYYLGNVLGNMALMGMYVTMGNAPGIPIAIALPVIVRRVSKRNLALFGSFLCLGGQIIFCFSPTGNLPLLFATALLRGIGFGFTMGLIYAITGDTIEYGEWKTGVRIQGILFSVQAVSQKLGQGGITAIFGIFIAAIGYDGLKQVQEQGTINGIEMFFKYVPLLVYIIQIAVLFAYKLDKEFPQILKDLEARKAKRTEVKTA
jgi:GPH family glycoside/pentoside/hexuronide:cation symporter